MRKILLLLLFSSFCSAQNIEIRLANAWVGTSLNASQGDFSNNATLNAILVANNVVSYNIKLGHPYPDFNNKVFNANCNNCNTQQFISQLTNSGIVEFAQPYAYDFFSDALYVEISNSTIGTMTGTSNGNITTNDTGLNQIFQDFDVFYYQQFAPNSSNPEILKVHFLTCNCNNIALKSALDNYTSVIESTEYISRVELLKTPDFETKSAKIYPNPFQNYFEIETQESISDYKLFDISGKLYVDTKSKDELKSTSSTLSNGIYFLKLQLESGEVITKKIVKN